MVCLKKMFNGEIIFHLKRRLKRLCYHNWKAWDKLLSSSGLKKNTWTFLSSTIHPWFWEKQSTRHQILCTNTQKKKKKIMNNWKFIFPWRKINCYVLQIAKAQLRDLVHDFWKKYYEVDVSSPWWCTNVYTKFSAYKACKKNVYQNFQFMQPLIITFMCIFDF